LLTACSDLSIRQRQKSTKNGPVSPQNLALPQVDLIDEPPELARHWRQLGAIEQTAPKRWMDAYLAAFAMAAGVLLVSLDRDFSHFEQQGLKFQLLLADGSGGKSA
jgi:predicted nucleic acid-binding protein